MTWQDSSGSKCLLQEATRANTKAPIYRVKEWGARASQVGGVKGTAVLLVGLGKA